MPTTERLAIFIDGSNFYHSVKDTISVEDRDIDFNKLIKLLKKSRLIISVYYYNASLDINYNQEIYWKQQKFFNELRAIPGINLVLCKMQKIRKPDGKFEYSVKGDDIHLSIDMLSLAYEDTYDVALLVSGDGDFEPLIKKVKKLGKRVENAYFSVSRSDALRHVCDSAICLDSLILGCLKS